MTPKPENGHKYFFEKYLKPNLLLYVGVFSLGIFGLLFSLLTPIVLKIFVDDVLIGHDVNVFHIILFALFALYFVSALSRFASGYLSSVLNLKMYLAISEDIYMKVLSSSLRDIKKFRTGDLITRMTNNINSVIRIYTSITIELFTSSMSIVFPLIIMLSLNVELTIIVLSPVLLAIFAVVYFGEKVKVKQRNFLETSASLMSHLKEYIMNLPLVKVLDVRTYIRDKYLFQLNEYYNDSLTATKTSLTNTSLNTLIFGFPTLLTFIFGGSMVLSEKLTLGTLIAFMSYSGIFFSPISKLSLLWTDYKSSSAAFDRVQELYGLDDDTYGADDLRVKDGTITINNLSFSYDERKILSNFSAEFHRGLNYIIGGNGAGKTTLLFLLYRLYLPEEGEILIDDQNITNVNEKSLKENVSIVFSEPYLFDGTIFDNISMGKVDVSHEGVMHAAKLAKVHDFIMGLPHQYMTCIGESGEYLSSGEKQKIALARAIVRDTPILILDEMTESIDIESKKSINDVIKGLQDKTIIIVTHDSTDIDKTGHMVC